MLAVVQPPGSVECSLGFAVSMLRLQTALASAPIQIQAVLHVVPSVCDVLKVMADDSSFRAAVCVNSDITFPAGLILRALSTGQPYVTGVYPLPRLDWERIKEKAATKTVESAQFWGNTYNVDASKAKFLGGGYIEVDRADPGVVVLTRDAAEAIHAKKPASDADIPRAWGKAILADIDHGCSSFGSMDFFGCVGMRNALR